MAESKASRPFMPYLEEQLKDPEFRKEWDRLQEEDKLAQQLVRLRMRRGLTQAEVAQMVGTKQAAISRLEHRPPRHLTKLLRKVAALYGREVKARIELVPRSSPAPVVPTRRTAGRPSAQKVRRTPLRPRKRRAKSSGESPDVQFPARGSGHPG